LPAAGSGFVECLEAVGPETVSGVERPAKTKDEAPTATEVVAECGSALPIDFAGQPGESVDAAGAAAVDVVAAATGTVAVVAVEAASAEWPVVRR